LVLLKPIIEASEMSLLDLTIGERRRMSKATAQRPSCNVIGVVSNPRSPEQDSFGDFFHFKGIQQ